MSTVVEWTLAQAVEEGERHFPARPQVALAAVEALFPGIESAGDEALLARCLVLRSSALVHLGRRAEAESSIAAAERHFSATGHERGLVTLLNLRSILAHRASDYPGSIRHLQEALRRARPHRWPEVIANLTGNLGLDLAYLGDYAPALAVLEESLEQWRKVGRSPAMIPTLINLGFTCQRAGAEAAALGHYEEAYQLAVEDEDAPRQAVVLCNLANTLGRLGRTTEAHERARQALEMARAQPIRFHLAHALECWAGAENTAGDALAARGALDEALEIYRELGNGRGVAVVELQLARLSSSADGPAAVRHAHFERALEAARTAGMKAEQAEALAGLAEGARAAGDLASALTHLDAARALERSLQDEETRRRLVAVHLHREVEALRQELETERIRRAETDRLLAEVGAQRALAEEESRQKTAILQIAAHDLRSPAACVVGCLDLAVEMLETGTDAALAADLVDDARQAATELLDLLNRLMDLAAIERGEVSVAPQRLDAEVVLRPILRRWHGAMAAKGQTLRVRAEKAVWIMADPDRLGQMVANLLSNASKYSPPSAVVEFDMARRRDRLRISILDHGPGIAPRDRERLFRPFQKLSSRPTAGETSTGLGLHIVKVLAERQAAQLGYTDRAGGGSEFYLEFAMGAKPTVPADRFSACPTTGGLATSASCQSQQPSSNVRKN